jgi:SAM-dependent methyltransferase
MKRGQTCVVTGVLVGVFLIGYWTLPTVWVSGGAAKALAQGAKRADDEGKKIVPYVPTPQRVVDRMLELAQVKKGDVVYDLGSGDGRIVVTAAKKYGVHAIGFEIDPERIKESRENIRKAGVGHLVEIRQQDIRAVDLSRASVLTMYLLPQVNLMIRPNIWKQMKPGSRVVSHDFDMGDWKPLKVEHLKDGSGWEHTLYLWRVEAKPAFRRGR